jgi:cell shape-determining protein MreD
MKLTHIFWSLLTLALIIFIPSLLYRPNSKLGGGPDLLLLFVLIWLITTGVSPIIIILKIARVVKRKIEFLRVLLMIFNFYFGCYGIYMILSGQIMRSGPFYLPLFILNLIWGGVLLIIMSTNSSKDDSVN